jgi:hypothetical protein
MAPIQSLAQSLARATDTPGASHLAALRLLSFVGAAPDCVRPHARVLCSTSHRRASP